MSSLADKLAAATTMQDIERALALAEPRRALSFVDFSREVIEEKVMSAFVETMNARAPYALELAQMRNVLTMPALHDAVRRVLSNESKSAAAKAA